MSQRSHVEVGGWGACHYDLMMDLFLVGRYNEFDLDRQWFPFRWAFRRVECELASEFLSLDLKDMLAHQGFGSFVT